MVTAPAKDRIETGLPPVFQIIVGFSDERLMSQTAERRQYKS
jgi:hypothetical protein